MKIIDIIEKPCDTNTKVMAILGNAGINYVYGYVGICHNAFNGKTAMDQWRVSFQNRARTIEYFDFYTGIGHRIKNKLTAPFTMESSSFKLTAPSAATVLHSLILESDAATSTFDNWCAELGYDNDSIHAQQMYLACQKNTTKLTRFIDSKTLALIQECLVDF